MADHNSYLQYKRDTRHLLYWIIHASNSIIKSSSLQESPGTLPKAVNTTGQITVSTLVSISKLIAKHVDPIPSTIYSLFQSVIAAGTAFHSLFQQSVSNKPDPEIENSNVSHKHFIDALTEAFAALGGESWASRQQTETARSDEENLKDVIFKNKFSALGLNGPSGGEVLDDSDEGESNGPSARDTSVRQEKKSTGKGKKGKRGNKAKGKPKSAAKEPSLDEVPLESFRIIEDENGLVTDYLMAVYSLIQELMELRHTVQHYWQDVSYSGLNSATAGTMSNIAIAIITKTQSAIFVDFPGNDSYEAIMNTITRGDPEKAQGMFHVSAMRMRPGSEVVEEVHKMDIDVKEQFLIHAYQDLLDFITDFQSTRSGKPTKRMLSEIRDWDPHFDLRRATAKERVKWRRAYTINWLYDLINVFSSIVVQRNTMKGQNWKLENVDWSVRGPWNKHRRLFGLNEFAGDITSLAMQKPGTDIRKKILPHHVFHMQCIVDSMTVSRGWSLNSVKGHVLRPPARGFRPRRDVDLFLDRDNTRIGHGFCAPVCLLAHTFENDAMMHGDPNRHENQLALLKELLTDFVDWLGETKYVHGLRTIPPSRFSNTNSNGLWEYSPFLCGVGLMEALELAYGVSFMIWDRMPEPMCAIHLHDMLVQKGYISKEIGLYATLQQMFQTSFFAGGKVPTSDFVMAFQSVVSKSGSRRATFERRAIRRNVLHTAVDIHGLFESNSNRFFKQKSLLRIYREAEWNYERVPDEEIPPASALAMIRISHTKRSIDSATGQRVLDSTPLTSLLKSQGLSDETMAKMSLLMQDSVKDKKIPQSFLTSLPKGYRNVPLSEPKHGGTGSSRNNFSNRALLDLLKFDIMNDISADGRPLSSLNYVFVTVQIMLLFEMIEDELKRLGNPLWARAYEEDPFMLREERVSLTALILTEQNEECMKVVGQVFEKLRVGWMGHIYWQDLMSYKDMAKSGAANAAEDEPPCVIM